ncbi:hypothetical protein [Microvirga sp. TS319]|uniref:hypothetical protein n=1 Tax=Microvirga sp. TS319 TaxID=3241165 RepID=UPI00351A73B5
MKKITVAVAAGVGTVAATAADRMKAIMPSGALVLGVPDMTGLRLAVAIAATKTLKA